MKAAIIIPARMQSTRLPGKMLLDRTGRPLICHTLQTADIIRKRSDGFFVSVMVAADDERVVNAVNTYCQAHGIDARAVMTDPNHQSGSDRIAEAAAALPPDITAVLNIQGDEPELPPDAVLELAAMFRSQTPDIATLVYPLARAEDRANPALVKAVLAADGRALYFSRAEIPFRRDTWQGQPPCLGHVGIYFYRREALARFVTLPQSALERTEKLEQLRALENGMSLYAHILREQPPKGIDTPEDYEAFVRKCAQ